MTRQCIRHPPEMKRDKADGKEKQKVRVRDPVSEKQRPGTQSSRKPGSWWLRPANSPYCDSSHLGAEKVADWFPETGVISECPCLHPEGLGCTAAQGSPWSLIATPSPAKLTGFTTRHLAHFVHSGPYLTPTEEAETSDRGPDPDKGLWLERGFFGRGSQRAKVETEQDRTQGR